MENNNELKGEIACPFCQLPANVYINKKKKLYARCPECGCLQPTGKAPADYFSQFVPIGTLSQKQAEKPAIQAEIISEINETQAEIKAGVTSEPGEQQRTGNKATSGKPVKKILCIVGGLGVLLLGVSGVYK